jgi:hypothetical protein
LKVILGKEPKLQFTYRFSNDMKNIMSTVSSTISKGTFWLASQQNNGIFPSETKRVTPFTTSLISLALFSVPDSKSKQQLLEKSLALLLKEKSLLWSYNYWIRNSPEAGKNPNPDDLDCTSCALSAIFLNNKSIVTGDVMARVISLFTTLEKKEGGPYRKWLVPNTSKTMRKDIDIAVNANIGYFLSLYNINLPNLSAFIERCILHRGLQSPYYVGIVPSLYFISRWYKGKQTQTLRTLLLNELKDKARHNPQNVALIVSSLISIGCIGDVKRSHISYLCSSYKDGWNSYPFIVEKQNREQTIYTGSSSLTTAFCLEALSKYRNELVRIENEKKKRREELEGLILNNKIFSRATDCFRSSGRELSQKGITMIRVIEKQDSKHYVALLPYYFWRICIEKKQISHDVLVKLGTINVLGWVAYTLFDDVLDEEGKPSDLSVATTALRTITSITESIDPINKEVPRLFHKLMDMVDGANTWETLHCRTSLANGYIMLDSLVFPPKSSLPKIAERSIAHVFGPCVILLLSHLPNAKKEVANIIQFYLHYFIVKQLNDDAHDWKDDILHGHINPVVQIVLKGYKHTHKKKRVSLKTLLPVLEKQFWSHDVLIVCNLMDFHIKKARVSLHQMQSIQTNSFFDVMLDDMQRLVESIKENHKQSKQFLSAYK